MPGIPWTLLLVLSVKQLFSEEFRLVLLNDLYWGFEVPGRHWIAFIELSVKHFFSEGFRLVLLNDLFWGFEVHCIKFIELSELNPKLIKFCLLNWLIFGFRPILVEFSELSPILLGLSRLGSMMLEFSELRWKGFCIIWLPVPVLLVITKDCWLAFLAWSFLNLTW